MNNIKDNPLPTTHLEKYSILNAIEAFFTNHTVAFKRKWKEEKLDRPSTHTPTPTPSYC